MSKYGVPDHLKSQFFRDLWRDINVYGLDATILIHGRKRTGKSWLALKILEILNLYKMKNIDYDVIIQSRVHFEIDKFAKAIGGAKKKGMVLILDEAGVDASNMEWWKGTLKNLRDIQHVDGIRHLILIIVLPKMQHLAKSSRDMVNIEIKTIHCDKRKRMTKCKITHRGFFDVNRDRGVYHRTRAGDTIRATWVGPPKKELTDAYEKYSRPYKEKIIEEKVEEILRLSNPQQTEEEINKRNDEIIAKILKNPNKYRKKVKSDSTKEKTVFKIQAALVSHDFGITKDETTLIKQLIEREHSDFLVRYNI